MNIRRHIGVAVRTLASKTMAKSNAGKVFAIGFNKTGTTSLHDIFTQLGYLSYHGTAWRNTSRPALYFFYDSFCDGIPDDFRRLDQMFPNSKFILQVRNLDSWLDSRLEHIRRLPPGKTRDADWTAQTGSIQEWVKRRNQHHIDVLTYFKHRPNDLLLINFIRDPVAAEKISAFLGHAVPVEKPHANRNPAARAKLRNKEMITVALAGLGIPEDDYQNDIYCPSLLPVQTGNIPPDTDQIAVHD